MWLRCFLYGQTPVACPSGPTEKCNSLDWKVEKKQRDLSPFLGDSLFKKKNKIGALTWKNLGVRHLKMNFNKQGDKQILLCSLAQVSPSGLSEEV